MIMPAQGATMPKTGEGAPVGFREVRLRVPGGRAGRGRADRSRGLGAGAGAGEGAAGGDAAAAAPLTTEEREVIIDQATLMLDGVYAHLLLSSASWSPVQ